MNNEFIIIISCIVISIHFLYSTREKFFSLLLVKNRKYYQDLLYSLVSLCYNKIYNDEILPRITSRDTLNISSKDSITRNIVEIFYKTSNKNTISKLLSFYGTEEILIYNIVLIIDQKMTDDEIGNFIKKTNEDEAETGAQLYSKIADNKNL